MSDQPLGGLPLQLHLGQGQGPGLRAKTQNLADNPPAPGTSNQRAKPRSAEKHTAGATM